jgi:hypothetical protein
MWLKAAGGALALLLVPVIWQNQHRLNTDAIAYLRLAEYYATGQTSLMVSGYWGPMFSWLTAPLLGLGMDPTLAGRVIVGCSAVVFWAGCLALFRAAGLSAGHRAAGAWLTTGTCLLWAADNLTPDLLVSGLMAFAWSRTAADEWLADRRWPWQAGLLWGTAYLAKAVAFPLGLVAIVVAAIRRRGADGPCPWRIRFRAVAVTLAGLLLVAGPWMTVLSIKYGKLTFSTTAKIAHAVTGPPDVERYHPFARVFHQPAPGRVTSWEDPAPDGYRYWKPWQSRAYFEHQIRVLAGNARVALQVLSGFDALGVGLLLSGFGVLCLAWRRRGAAHAGWWRVLVPLAIVSVLYLPFPLSLAEGRYFLLTYPLLLSAGFLAVAEVQRLPHSAARLLGRALLTVVVVAFALPTLVILPLVLRGLPDPASASARDLADRMARAALRGPIAGSALWGNGRAGLYTAYFLRVPWYGDRLEATAEDFVHSGARFAILRRGQPLAGELLRDRRFQNLDEHLYSGDATNFPLVVFEIGTGAADR